MQFRQTGWKSWAVWSPAERAERGSGERGNKRESRQSNGRAAGNNGFRFLLMSHLGTLLFPNKSNREESAVMDWFMGFAYPWSAKKHWSY